MDDTTDPEGTEARLRESERRLRAVLEQGPLAIAVTGPRGEIVFRNAEFDRLWGRPAHDTTAETYSRVYEGYHLDGRPVASGEWPGAQALQQGRVIQGEVLEIVHLSGRRIACSFNAGPIRDEDGRISGAVVMFRDVTEERRMQAALERQSEERSRAILETARDYAIFTTDAADRIDTWPIGAEAVFGWTADEALGQPYEMTFTPEDRAARVPETELRVAREEGQAPNVRWHQRRDGSRVFIEGIVRPLTAPDGTVTGYVKVGQDVTERRTTEERLRESEARFRLMADAVPQIVWITDPDGRVEFFNKQWSDYTGATYQPDTAADVAASFVHPDDGAATVAAFDQARATGTTFLVEHRIRSKAGDYRWFLVRGEPYRDPQTGRITRWFGASVDIHDRQKAEAELRASEERLRELNETLERRVADALAERQVLADFVESTNTSILAFDLDHRILAINEANAAEIERVYGRRPQVGDNFLELIADMPEHRAQVARNWDRALSGEEFMIIEEFGDAAHERVTYEVRFNVLRDRNGQQVGAYQAAFDVSDRVRAQAELEAAQEALRQSQKMEAMGQLTGGVAHDFNNLLTPIIGSLDRLVTRGVGSERERRLMAGALESAERAKTLVQRLLAFARRQPLQPVAVALPALVEGMAELIGSTLGPAIKLRIELAADLPPAKADPNQLEMALLNLAVNARDAMPEGGILTVAASLESVRGNRGDAGLRQGHYLRLSVSDTGTGMDEATLASAVEPFFSTKGIGRGTGLGLSMVHGLTAQLGGGLAIRSKPGHGTTVELWLPISDEPAEAADRGRVAVPVIPSRGLALLVDDEDLVRMSTADMLADLGFDVIEAGRAEDALQLLQEGASVDLLVTDHLMPGMSGAELARKAQEIRPGLPILVVSGYAEAEGLAPGLPRLVKPFRMAELAESVANVMQGKDVVVLRG